MSAPVLDSVSQPAELTAEPVSPLADRVGLFASAACAVHCMLAPVMLAFAPSLSGVWEHPAAHYLLVGVSVPVAAYALWRGFARHSKVWIAACGALGVALISLGVAWPHLPTQEAAAAAEAGTECDACCPTVDEETGSFTLPTASLVTLLGGLVLVVAHGGNLFALRVSSEDCLTKCCPTPNNNPLT